MSISSPTIRFLQSEEQDLNEKKSTTWRQMAKQMARAYPIQTHMYINIYMEQRRPLRPLTRESSRFLVRTQRLSPVRVLGTYTQRGDSGVPASPVGREGGGGDGAGGGDRGGGDGGGGDGRGEGGGGEGGVATEVVATEVADMLAVYCCYTCCCC